MNGRKTRPTVTVQRDFGEVFGRSIQRDVKMKINEKAIQDYLKSFTAEDEAQ